MFSDSKLALTWTALHAFCGAPSRELGLYLLGGGRWRGEGVRRSASPVALLSRRTTTACVGITPPRCEGSREQQPSPAILSGTLGHSCHLPGPVCRSSQSRGWLGSLGLSLPVPRTRQCCPSAASRKKAEEPLVSSGQRDPGSPDTFKAGSHLWK